MPLKSQSSHIPLLSNYAPFKVSSLHHASEPQSPHLDNYQESVPHHRLGLTSIVQHYSAAPLTVPLFQLVTPLSTPLFQLVAPFQIPLFAFVTPFSIPLLEFVAPFPIPFLELVTLHFPLLTIHVLFNPFPRIYWIRPTAFPASFRQESDRFHLPHLAQRRFSTCMAQVARP